VFKDAKFRNIFNQFFEKMAHCGPNLRDFPGFLDAFSSTCNFNWPNNDWLFYWTNLRTFLIALWLKNHKILAKN
jgi:hypothetical protein